MARLPRISVLQPDAAAPPERLEEWLLEAGVRCSIVPLWQRDVPPLTSAGEGIVVLGGLNSAHDRTPWRDPLADLLADAHSIDLPVLGICLGHQILADLHGGEVVVADGRGGEQGVLSVEWLPAASDDPVLGPLAERGPTPVIQSHRDVVSVLPPGAVELARSELYPHQAWRLGSTWGVQFHPEASPELLGTWARGSAKPDAAGPARLVAEARAVDTQLAEAGRLLAHGFASFVKG